MFTSSTCETQILFPFHYINFDSISWPFSVQILTHSMKYLFSSIFNKMFTIFSIQRYLMNSYSKYWSVFFSLDYVFVFMPLSFCLFFHFLPIFFIFLSIFSFKWISITIFFYFFPFFSLFYFFPFFFFFRFFFVPFPDCRHLSCHSYVPAARDYHWMFSKQKWTIEPSRLSQISCTFKRNTH